MPRHPNRSGRDVAGLLGDFDHDLPRIPAEAKRPREKRLFELRPARGRRRPGAGWSPAGVPVSVWRMTSDQAPVLWPFVAAPALPPTGAQMGIDYFSGASMYFDPNAWVRDDAIPVTNANVLVQGKPGTGKSATIKACAVRMSDFGYRTLVLGDPKDEYEDLCRFLGQDPIVIGPGHPHRINPLAFGPLAQGWDTLDATELEQRSQTVFNRWLTVLRGLVGSQRVGQHHIPFGPSDEVAVLTVLRDLTGYSDGYTRLVEATIPQVWRALSDPTDALVADCRFADVRQFLDQTRLLRDSLGKLVQGELAGMFDAPTNINLDWKAPITSLSLSRVSDEAVGIALTCVNSWGRGMRELADPGDMRLVIRDEVWRQMRLGPEAVKSFDADLRLSRKDGDIQIAAAHKPSDWLSVGDANSQAVAIAKDMLHLADTKILCGQDAEVADELNQLLDLGAIGQNLVTGWCRQARGRAVWMLGDRLYKVQTTLHPLERQLTYTNAALEEAGDRS
nr:ATP-binding protein [Propionibacterium sp.]